MVHFPPLLGYKDHPGLSYIEKKALKDLESLEKGGADAFMIENNYDIPHKIFVPPEVISSFTILAYKLRKASALPMGISVLWNDYKTALSIAKIVKAQFIRIPVFVDKVKTNYGVIEGNPKEILAYRKKIKAEKVALFTDIHVKHAKLIERKKIEDSAKEAIKAGSDALILTGEWTGKPPKIEVLKKLRKIIGNFPILIGSGITSKNLKKYIKLADGFIVGTFLKTGKKRKNEINLKKFTEKIDPKKVKLLLKEREKYLKS